jgi:hypothetical protein
VSYMRGSCYIWRDDERVHVWAEDGCDGWHDSSWAEGQTHAPRLDAAPHAEASGVGLRQEIADAYVRARADRTKGKTGLTTAEREELTRLRRENRILQEERDILKKATAFFAKQSR